MSTLTPTLLSLALLGACGDNTGTGDTGDGHVPGSTYDLTTDQGLYLLHIQMNPDPPTAGDAELVLMVHDASDDSMLMGPTVTVTPWMPEMDHGLSEDPLVVEDGGYYTVTFAYTMAGTWDLTFDVDGELGQDSGVLTVEVQ